MPETLTPRQVRILDTIRKSVEDKGYPPTLREIGSAVGLTSSSSVAHQVRQIETKGWIKTDPNKPRTITVLPPACDFDNPPPLRPTNPRDYLASIPEPEGLAEQAAAIRANREHLAAPCATCGRPRSAHGPRASTNAPGCHFQEPT